MENEQPQAQVVTNTGAAAAVEQTDVVLEQFYRYLLAERGVSENTLQGYTSDLRQWRTLLGGKLYGADGHAITEAVVNLLHSGVSPRSVGRKISSLRALYRYLIRRRIVAHNPLRNVPLPKFERPLPSPPTKLEIEKMLAAIDTRTPKGKRDCALLVLLEAAGLRISEALSLDLADVHLGDRYVSIRHGKGDKDRDAPIDRRAVQALGEYIEHARPLLRRHDSELLFPMTRAWAWHTISRLAGAALGRHVHPHELRHAYGTELVKRLELRDVADLMGHASVDTTQLYLSLDLSALEEAFYRCHPRGRIRDEGD